MAACERRTKLRGAVSVCSRVDMYGKANGRGLWTDSACTLFVSDSLTVIFGLQQIRLPVRKGESSGLLQRQRSHLAQLPGRIYPPPAANRPENNAIRAACLSGQLADEIRRVALWLLIVMVIASLRDHLQRVVLPSAPVNGAVAAFLCWATPVYTCLRSSKRWRP